jgi:hypothetical protein
MEVDVEIPDHGDISDDDLDELIHGPAPTVRRGFTWRRGPFEVGTNYGKTIGITKRGLPERKHRYRSFHFGLIKSEPGHRAWLYAHAGKVEYGILGKGNITFSVSFDIGGFRLSYHGDTSINIPKVYNDWRERTGWKKEGTDG